MPDFTGFKTKNKKPIVPAWKTAPLTPVSQLNLRGNEQFAVDCGRNDLVVIDCDSRKAWKTFVGLWIENEGTSRIKTPVVKTPRGKHVYFNAIDGHPVKNTVSKLGQGIDTRAAGGYVIAPPTPGYEYLLKASVLELPLWLANMLTPADSPLRRTDAAGGQAKHSINGLMQTLANAPEGQRNANLYWCLQRVSEMPQKMHHRLINQLSREASYIGLGDWEISNTVSSVFGGHRG
ncbi:bifunctional DNA primase/polymerase [Arthrobacter sp. H35-D1]|uniref:bifunctional DNA primase/polymerase n=1 Tax=Arthrobacter sp. H35-D1 TaxID=3046202 RepID=UPI0024B8F086|nr:bifunctional DNA primase/polymerase [Arthrobacter sp. H35-D1]MDJ0315071.1 bifunctional DNA primase/polymerase [Arthrobacter sp. H35-D1]